MKRNRIDSILEVGELQRKIDENIEEQISDSEEELRKAIRQVKDTEENPEESFTFGQRLADQVTGFCGSWAFILSFAGVILLWTTLNTLGSLGIWDAYPFTFLNLFISILTAIQVPLILMSQNRQAVRDRRRIELTLKKASLDLRINNLSEYKIAEIQRQLLEIRQILWHIHEDELRAKFIKPENEKKKK